MSIDLSFHNDLVLSSYGENNVVLSRLYSTGQVVLVREFRSCWFRTDDGTLARRSALDQAESARAMFSHPVSIWASGSDPVRDPVALLTRDEGARPGVAKAFFGFVPECDVEIDYRWIMLARFHQRHDVIGFLAGGGWHLSSESDIAPAVYVPVSVDAALERIFPQARKGQWMPDNERPRFVECE